MDPLRTALGLYFISGLRQIDNFMSALFSSSFLQGLKVLFEQSAETEEYFFVHVKNLAFKNDLFIKLTDIKQVEKKTRFVFVFRMDDSWVETDDEPLINIAETVSNFALYPTKLVLLLPSADNDVPTLNSLKRFTLMTRNGLTATRASRLNSPEVVIHDCHDDPDLCKSETSTSDDVSRTRTENGREIMSTEN